MADQRREMSDENPASRYPLGEPSVLDYVKSLFRFGEGERIEIPFEQEILSDDEHEQRQFSIQAEVDDVQVQPSLVESESTDFYPSLQASEGNLLYRFPWRSLLALGLALIAQRNFEPPHTTTELGIAFYIGAFALLGWALHQGEWRLPALPPPSWRTDPLTYRGLPLVLGVSLLLLSFWFFGNHLFTPLNVIVWILSVVFLMSAFWLGRPRSLFVKIRPLLRFHAWTILLVAATALVIFFRFYQTASVPPEPFSDHAEKILDIYDVSQGQLKVFFPRNTGREAFQMYWTLLIARLFGTGLTFFSLKLGTAILGLLTLPFVYLLGKEIGGARVGLLAFLLVGIGYWPNVISRVGLRFPLYPLFAAPVLLYLIRGLRTRNRNDFLLSGLFLGIGLHGYSPMRIVPFVVAAAFILYWLHTRSKEARQDLPIWLVMLALVALFVFLPLLRYWLDDPAQFSFRALTRLGTVEQPLPAPAYQVFVSNLWRAMVMSNYDDGEIWVHSVTGRPALDTVSAALFLLGVGLLIVRYVRHRHWLDLFLLVSIPLLQLPSSLSLAFPNENPALNRAGAAYIPAFIIAAMALEALLSSLGRGGIRNILTWGLAGMLLVFSAWQNYDLVFNQYYTSFRNGSWNSTDMGKTILQFKQIYKTTKTVWIVPFPHWVDTRLPAIWAGEPNRDLAIPREDLPDTVEFSGPKLFLVKADLDDPLGNDQKSLNVLESLYPDGHLRLFDSDIPGHDFWIFTVPDE